MDTDRTLPEGLTRAMFDAIAALREWVTPPPAPDDEVRAWPLFSGWEYGGVYCAKDGCGCAAEGSELIRGDDHYGDEAATFTLADLHARIGEHIAYRAQRRAEDAEDAEDAG
jgi:hypothetical protein